MFKTNHKLVLASASPRRKELLAMLSLPFDIITSEVEETSVQATTMQDYVKGVALLKTRDVAKKPQKPRLLEQIRLLFMMMSYSINLKIVRRQFLTYCAYQVSVMRS